MNLHPPSWNARDRRPHQTGVASGTKHGAPISVAVEWLVDSGADIGVVRKSVGARFDLVPVGLTASPTTGGGGITVQTGLEVHLEAETEAGVTQRVIATQPIGVKSNDFGSDIVGMDQLAAQNVTVVWNSSMQVGCLRLPNKTGSLGVGTDAAEDLPSANVPEQRATGRIVDHGSWVEIDGIRIEKARR